MHPRASTMTTGTTRTAAERPGATPMRLARLCWCGCRQLWKAGILACRLPNAGSTRYFLVLRWGEHELRIVLQLHFQQTVEIGAPIGDAMVGQAGIGEILVTPLARERLVESRVHIALPSQAVVNIHYCIAIVPVNVGIRKPFRLPVHESGRIGRYCVHFSTGAEKRDPRRRRGTRPSAECLEQRVDRII